MLVDLTKGEIEVLLYALDFEIDSLEDEPEFEENRNNALSAKAKLEKED